MIEPPGKNQWEADAGGARGERVVYVLPEQAACTSDDGVQLLEIWDTLWRGKWLVFVLTLVFACGSVAYALLASEWYRAEVLLSPADTPSSPMFGGQLGGLAALAGVTTGDGDTAEAIALLRSREFLRAFIVDQDLMPVLFAKHWNAGAGRWKNEDPERSPDLRDGVRFLQDRVVIVTEDRRTGLVQVAVEWHNPEIAAEWATELVRRLNSIVRERALQEAEANVLYLQEQLQRTHVLTLQQSVGRLLEGELHKLMVARGREEYAFKVLDSAEAPNERVRPRRTVIAVVGTFLGAMFGIALVLSVSYFRRLATSRARLVR